MAAITASVAPNKQSNIAILLKTKISAKQSLMNKIFFAIFFPIFILANTLHSADIWLCKKINGDPCDGSSSGQPNIWIRVEGHGSWLDPRRPQEAVYIHQTHKHVLSPSERRAIALRAIMEARLQRAIEKEQATQKELTERISKSESYHKYEEKQIRKIKIQIMKEEGLKKLNSIYNNHLSESEIQTINENLAFENPLAFDLFKELDSVASSTSRIEREIQPLVNQATSLLYQNQGNSEIKEKAEYLLEILFDADQLSSKPDTKTYGQRLLKRAKALYSSLNPNNSITPDSSEPLRQEARELFFLGNVSSNTFTGLEIINIANTAVDIPSIASDEILRFHLTAALQQANIDSATGDWLSAIDNIDRAWNLIDYSKGVVKGLYEFGTDTANGLIHLVTHPIDSAAALYDTVINYDKTFDVIRTSMETIWNEYDTYSAEEKGKLHAKIAADIVATVLTFGGLRNAAKIAQAAQRITEESASISRVAVSSWASTKKSNSVGNAFKHWKKHQAEFPELHNSLEYVNKSRDFISNPPPGTLTRIRLDGDKLFFHQESNIFAISDKSGAIKTFYKPDVKKHKYKTNLEYFHAQ